MLTILHDVWQYITASIACRARVKASALPLCLCVRACIYSLSVWLVAAGPGNTLTQAHKHSHTCTRPLTHSHTSAHGATWTSIHQRYICFLYMFDGDRQAAVGHCLKLPHRLACMGNWGSVIHEGKTQHQCNKGESGCDVHRWGSN